MQDAIFVLFVSLVLTGSLSGPAAAAEKEAAAPGAASEAPQPPSESAAAVPAPIGKAEIVKSIEFEGNRKFKAHVLRERLGFQLGDRLDPFLAEGGRVTIMEVYRKVGYPSVKVTLDRDKLADGHLLYVIEEGPRVQVASIEFAGNDSFRARTLRQVIKLKQRKWLLWSTYYTEEAVKEDTDRLRDFYYGQGYLDYKITSQTEFTDEGDRVHVIFIIEEGPVYHVSDIVFTGQTKYTDEQLRAKIKVKEGDVYKKPKVEKDAKEVANLYREQGYVDAEVRQGPKFTAQTEDFLVAVTFTIREGKQFRIGQLDVTGNDTTKDKAIRRILDEYGFTPGALYNAKIAPKEGGGLLEKYIQRGVIADQTMIRPVNPAPGSDPNSRDARVDIKEGMTGMIRPGVGFSSDSGVIGQLIYEQRNFDIGDVPKSWDEVLFPWKAWRGGGERFSVRLEPGTRYSAYSVNFVDPYWNDQPVTLDVLGRSWKWFRESYDENRLKGAFEFEQRMADYWRRSIGFRAEHVRIGELDFDAPQEIRDVKGNSDLFGVKFGVGKTAVDDLYDPTKGWRADASYEQVTGDFTFGLLEATAVRYISLHEDVLGRRTVLSGKVQAGTTVGEAPPFEKYYAGGSGRYGIRGFEYRGVSRRGLQTNVVNPERKDPIGSDWIFLAKSEVVVPLIGQNFNGLFFVDSGTVDSGSYRLSIGTGIEIKVPQIFGNVPMRFELGFPLLKSDGDQTQVFSFSGGGLF
ncbi:MAG: outer membrane protein assembly factor BamA [Phycisphaerae bacterium]|nr:outer membrane protein assembly factor BamA [Phycisphaerae bacterium]